MGRDLEGIMEVLLAFAFILTIIYLIALVDTIVSYIIKALALRSLCDIYGMEDQKWVAWVPVYNYHLLLDIGERGSVYVFLPILQIILIIVRAFSTSLVAMRIMSVIILAVTIWWIVVRVQAYKVISKKLDTTPVWLNIGVFIPGFNMVAWAVMLNKISKLKREGYFTYYSQ